MAGNTSPDVKRIDLGNEDDLREWSRKLDATPEQLREAVGAVGDHQADLRVEPLDD